MPGWEVFRREWKHDRLPVPYCSCLTNDLYQVYRRWCDKAYEKPLTLTKFSCLLSNRETKRKQEVHFGKRGTYMVFVIERAEETESINKQCHRFRTAISSREESCD
jgi:putative DNA primase/helicase